MRIALAAMSCDDTTGIGRIVRSLAREFDASGHDVTVIAQRIEHLAGSISTVNFSSVTGSKGLSRITFSVQTRRLFRRNRFDVSNAFCVGRGADVITAQSCHASAVEIQTAARRGRLSRRGIGLFDAVALRDERVLMTAGSTRHVIAVSQLVRDQLIRHYAVPESKITVIPNGVDFERLAAPVDPHSRALARNDLGFGESDFGLLFVGNEFDRKGLQTIIEAMSTVRDPSINLAVVGDDDPAPYAARARQLGVEKNIRFLGRLSGPERYFGAADVLVLPVWYEPYGMVVSEAMAAGLPVIASASTGALEGLRHEIHALFLNDPFDAEELAGALTRLRDDPALRLGIAARAREATKKLSWDRVAGQTLAVYNSVAMVK